MTTEPTLITLTLPESDHEGTLLIQRGDLAHLRRVAHDAELDFTALIRQALSDIADVERNPPAIAEPPTRKTTAPAKPPPEPAAPSEPMLQVPTRTKKGTTVIPARCLRIVDGESDEATQQQALKIAGRLLDSGLWDGQTPLGIAAVEETLRRLNGLTDKELNVLYSLEQFAQINPITEPDAALQDAPDDTSALDENELDYEPEVAPAPGG